MKPMRSIELVLPVERHLFESGGDWKTLR